jgi:hypothetical protein
VSTERTDEAAGGTVLTDRYKTSAEQFWMTCRAAGYDAYDTMDEAVRRGWHPVPSWGSQGWDLGGWPLVIIFHRHAGTDAWDVAEYVEGDVSVYRYPSRDMRDRATDELAFFHWKHTAKQWVSEVGDVTAMPDHLRGPYRG